MLEGFFIAIMCIVAVVLAINITSVLVNSVLAIFYGRGVG